MLLEGLVVVGVEGWNAVFPKLAGIIRLDGTPPPPSTDVTDRRGPDAEKGEERGTPGAM